MRSEFTVCYNDGTHLGDVDYVVFYARKLLRIYDGDGDATYGENADGTLTVTQFRYGQVFNSVDVEASKFWDLLRRWVWVRLRELVKYERFVTDNEKWRSFVIKVTVETGDGGMYEGEGHRITLSLGKESFSILVTRKVTEQVFLERDTVLTPH